MFEKVKAIVEIKVGDDLVQAIYITDLDKARHWLIIAENPVLIVEVTGMAWEPARGARWTGTEFESVTHHLLLPDMLYFAFVVDGVCVYVELLDPSFTEKAAVAAAYRTGPSFEVHYGRPE
jgi:hypothetical protein